MPPPIFLAQAQPAPGFDPSFFIMMGLLFVVFYFFIIRPQRKREDQRKTMIEAVRKGDRIVTVGGYQVGWVEDRLYPLGAELQRQAGRRGDVTLLVQNVRNDRLLNLHLQLDRVR